MDQRLSAEKQVVVIGAGPARLTVAYEVAQLDLSSGKMVGGLSRTESYKGFYFDLGGHRF